LDFVVIHAVGFMAIKSISLTDYMTMLFYLFFVIGSLLWYYLANLTNVPYEGYFRNTSCPV